MSKQYGRVTVEETDNGYIVETSYFAHGGESKRVFQHWKDAAKAIEQAMNGVKP